MSTTNDIYQRITNTIVEAIERGTGDYRMPWHVTGEASFSPINAASGKPYRGVNVLSLWATAELHHFPTGTWATYRQWQELGAQVRKGEKSSLVVFWKFTEKNGQAEEDADADDGKEARLVFARGYSVFNAAQVDGYSPEATPEPTANERIEHAEGFFASLRTEVRHGGSRAFYSPAGDYIQMPRFEAFRDAVAYYAILAHEAMHWTGARKRLDRDLAGRFGSESYAAEELVAELGAAFLCGDLRLANEPRPDHAAYVASWLKLLKNDTKAIFTAASKAQQAADWMHEQTKTTIPA